MKEPLTLLVLAIAVLSLSAIGTFGTAESAVQEEVLAWSPCYSSPELEFERDPYPQTVLPEPEPESTEDELDPFPTEDHLRVIGRLAENVTRLKIKEGGWWECGKFYKDEEEIKKLAMRYAYHIVKSAWEVSDPPYAENRRWLNEWGFSGTIWNESKFDRCALGRYPREKAYELGIIKKNRLTLSHTEEEVIKAVTDPRMQEYFKRTGFDMGLAQLLSRFYTKPDDYEYMLSLEGGAMEGARAMHDRGRYYKTDRPWLYWPGGKTQWYDDKVTRWARILGATKEEI